MNMCVYVLPENIRHLCSMGQTRQQEKVTVKNKFTALLPLYYYALKRSFLKFYSSSFYLSNYKLIYISGGFWDQSFLLNERKQTSLYTPRSKVLAVLSYICIFPFSPLHYIILSFSSSGVGTMLIGSKSDHVYIFNYFEGTLGMVDLPLCYLYFSKVYWGVDCLLSILCCRLTIANNEQGVRAATSVN